MKNGRGKNSEILLTVTPLFIKTSTANQSNIAYSILSLNTDKLQALFLRIGLSSLTIHIPSRQASPVFMSTLQVNSFFLSNHPINQILTDLKGDIDNNTKRTHGYDTPLPIMDRSPRQKSKKEMSNLNYALD